MTTVTNRQLAIAKNALTEILKETAESIARGTHASEICNIQEICEATLDKIAALERETERGRTRTSIAAQIHRYMTDPGTEGWGVALEFESGTTYCHPNFRMEVFVPANPDWADLAKALHAIDAMEREQS